MTLGLILASAWDVALLWLGLTGSAIILLVIELVREWRGS